MFKFNFSNLTYTKLPLKTWIKSKFRVGECFTTARVLIKIA